ncbi:MAG: hypothetical protein VX324_04805, partial [Pseudomonadota bacterium]|nr:hypothetical protein [Pseudomonadota bacterium]
AAGGGQHYHQQPQTHGFTRGRRKADHRIDLLILDVPVVFLPCTAIRRARMPCYQGFGRQLSGFPDSVRNSGWRVIGLCQRALRAAG